MSVIQKIRDKYARIAVIAIALALLGFIAMDAFTGRSNPFGSNGPSSNVGSVNGTNIKYTKYNDYVTQIEESYRGQNYPPYLIRQQAMEQAWNMMVSRTLLEEEFDKLGIAVTDKEITNTIIYNPELEEQMKQTFPEFVNQQTGVLDLQNLVQQINASRKGSSSEQKKVISDRFDQLILSRMNEKYGSLIINGSANVPKWMIEKQEADNAQIAKIAYVKKLYTSVSDSLIKVTDQEIQNYIDKHKEDFKQTESRSIAYVTFPVVPSANDSSQIFAQVQKLKDSFATTNDPVIYVESNSTSAAEVPVLTPGARLSPAVKDTLTKVPLNGVFGPYVDGGNVTLARLMEKKDLPDSVKCRHIIVSVPQGASDSSAKVLIDSIERAIKAGASWEEMAKKYNSDGTRETKGEMTFTYDEMTGPRFAPEFAQFLLFDGKPGDSKTLKTSFGWHYVNIMDWMAVQPYYKFAYLRNPLTASAVTIQEARNNANTFAGEARDEKSFNEQVDKVWRAKGFDKNIATNITPTASSVSNMMDARSFVKRIYEAKRGEVLQPEEVGNDFVVAVVTGIYEEGTQSPATARPRVEEAIRNTKKGELIAKELGAVTTLEAAATKWNSAIEVADSVTFNGGGQLGFEPKVIGAAFNPTNRNKIVPTTLTGIRGVYVVRVDNVSAVPSTGGTVAEKRKLAIENAKRNGGNPLEGLYNAAKIKDKRANHY